MTSVAFNQAMHMLLQVPEGEASLQESPWHRWVNRAVCLMYEPNLDRALVERPLLAATCERLVALGLSPCQRNAKKQTPLECALLKNCWEAIEPLCRVGALAQLPPEDLVMELWTIEHLMGHKAPQRRLPLMEQGFALLTPEQRTRPLTLPFGVSRVTDAFATAHADIWMLLDRLEVNQWNAPLAPGEATPLDRMEQFIQHLDTNVVLNAQEQAANEARRMFVQAKRLAAVLPIPAVPSARPRF